MFNDVYLGMTSFTASVHKIDECEINGLPRLPHSINILGRFEELKYIDHPNLCKYIDAKRDKHEKIVLATEYYESNWDKDYPNINTIGLDDLIDVFLKLISAVEYLHHYGIIVRSVTPNNVLWTQDDQKIKLANYGIYYMTNNGLDVNFPIGNASYLPPESLLDNSFSLSCPRSDVWSIAMLLLHAIIPIDMRNKFTEDNTIYEVLERSSESDFDVVHALLSSDVSLEPRLCAIVKKCLRIDVHQRLSISQMKHELLSIQYGCEDNNMEENFQCKLSLNFIEQPIDVLCANDVRTMYYLWTLAGGDLWKVHEQMCDGQGKLLAILMLPIVIQRDGEALWSTKIANVVKRPLSDHIYPLPLSKLMERLDKLPPLMFCEPQLKLFEEFRPFDFSAVQFNNSQSKEEQLIRSQPIWVKETDFEYQFRRILKFRRLLRGYPLTRNSFLKETSYDIPPLLRAEIWPLILNVDKDDAALRYMNVQGRLLNEKSASQISVDLPRCHSYDELIVSCTGQLKLGRILHAWLIHHPGLEYTQGMDSLCAVFTRLMFNNEVLAFACLEAFVDKFMGGLFCSSHGQALTEYCTILQQLLSFHKPNLSQAVNIFAITGFTASWIYTGFAHSLPLDKTIRLWDTVILGEPSFLMMVFIALLGQLDQESGFSSQATEQVFSVLSNLPEFDLDRCRQEAIDLAKKTPPSVTLRNVTIDTRTTVKSVDASICAPRISLNDMLLLIGEGVSDQNGRVYSPFGFDPNRLPPPILLDLRKKEYFEKGNVFGSISIPVLSASPHTTFSELESRNARSIIGHVEPSVKIIIGTVDDHVCDMVAKILSNTYRFQYVCVLKGGINEIRSVRPDILVVSH